MNRLAVRQRALPPCDDQVGYPLRVFGPLWALGYAGLVVDVDERGLQYLSLIWSAVDACKPDQTHYVTSIPLGLRVVTLQMCGEVVEALRDRNQRRDKESLPHFIPVALVALSLPEPTTRLNVLSEGHSVMLQLNVADGASLVQGLLRSLIPSEILRRVFPLLGPKDEREEERSSGTDHGTQQRSE